MILNVKMEEPVLVLVFVCVPDSLKDLHANTVRIRVRKPRLRRIYFININSLFWMKDPIDGLSFWVQV